MKDGHPQEPGRRLNRLRGRGKAAAGAVGSDGIVLAPPLLYQHGFRSSFRDWAAEQTDAPHAVMEAALAHVVRKQVEAAYARSDLFERRCALMDAWARHLVNGMGEKGMNLHA